MQQIGIPKCDLTQDQKLVWFGTFARFSQVLSSFERAKLSGRWTNENGQRAFRGAQDRGSWFYRNLANYLNNYALESAEGYTPPPSGALPAIQITTVHSSKGLQW